MSKLHRRRKINSVFVTGRNAVLELLLSSKTDSNIRNRIKALYIGNKTSGDKIKEIINLARSIGIKRYVVWKKTIEKLSGDERSQQVMLELEKEKFFIDDLIKRIKSQRTGLIVVVKDVDYESNLGSVIRTCEAGGVDALVYNGNIGITSVVRRVSMGASERLMILEHNVYQSLKVFRELGCNIIGVEVCGLVPYYRSNIIDGWNVLLFGGEDTSLTGEIKYCDQVVNIPMVGKVGSLNLNAAVAIILFDILRRKT